MSESQNESIVVTEDLFYGNPAKNPWPKWLFNAYSESIFENGSIHPNYFRTKKDSKEKPNWLLRTNSKEEEIPWGSKLIFTGIGGFLYLEN